MELQTFQYIKNNGWSINKFPELDSENTLVIVFVSPEFRSNPQAIRELSEHYPNSKMIGCSSSGEIYGSGVFDQSLSVAVIRFAETKIKIVKTSLNKIEESFAAGENIVKQLDAKDLRGIFVLSDGLDFNGSELVRGLNQENDTKIIITGGLAGDGSDFKSTLEIFNGEIITKSVVAVGFYGDHIHIGHSSRGGWNSFGSERLITRSKSNILYELDNLPALQLYKEYLGKKSEELPSSGLFFPLAIRKDKNDAKPLVRTVVGIDEKEQSLIFTGDLPQGYFAQLMRANFERLIGSVEDAANAAINVMSPQVKNITGPLLSIAISCVGRRLLLGERTEEETELLLSSLPKNTQQIGFYSYGEISPYGLGSCDFHNQTMTVTTFYES